MQIHSRTQITRSSYFRRWDPCWHSYVCQVSPPPGHTDPSPYLGPSPLPPHAPGAGGALEDPRVAGPQGPVQLPHQLPLDGGAGAFGPLAPVKKNGRICSQFQMKFAKMIFERDPPSLGIVTV